MAQEAIPISLGRGLSRVEYLMPRGDEIHFAIAEHARARERRSLPTQLTRKIRQLNTHYQFNKCPLHQLRRILVVIVIISGNQDQL